MIEDTFRYYPAPLLRRTIAAILDVILLFMVLFIFFEGLLLLVGQYMDMSVLESLQQQYYDIGVDQGVFSMSILSSFDSLQSTVVTSFVYSAISIDSSVYSAFINDPEVAALMLEMNQYLLTLFWVLIGASFGASLITYFVIPLFFKNGQTFGKYITKLMLVTKQGEPVQLRHSMVRFLVGIFGVDIMLTLLLSSFFGLFPIVLFVELFVVFSTKKNLALHDMISQTMVVDASREKMSLAEEEVSDSRTLDMLESEALRKKLSEE